MRLCALRALLWHLIWPVDCGSFDGFSFDSYQDYSLSMYFYVFLVFSSSQVLPNGRLVVPSQ